MKNAVAVMLVAAMVAIAPGCRRNDTTNGILPRVSVQTVTEGSTPEKSFIQVEYPLLADDRLNEGVAQRINAAIEGLILPDIAEFRRNAAEETATATSEGSSPPEALYLTVRYELPYLDTQYLCVRLRFDTYTGGAHGMTYTRVLNARLADGAVLAATDLFRDVQEGLTALSRLCATELKRQYGDDYEDLKSFVEAGTAPVADNFANVALEPGCLVVSFDPYQVGPYVAGPREVRITAADIISVLDVVPGKDAFKLTFAPAE